MVGNSKIFISYSFEDKEIAQEIVDFLEERNLKCFIAPRDIKPGVTYASNIIHAIEECSVIILIASHSMNNSDHVLNEIDAIVAKRKTLIPFFIEEFEMNDDLRYYLGRTQRILAYSKPITRYFSNLYNAVSSHLDSHNFFHKNLEGDEQKTSKNEEKSNVTTVFEYISERGIMINPEDRQRNVSFRTDTFINMFGLIFENVVKLSGEQNAKEMFHTAGYKCGQNFAQRLNSRWDYEEHRVSLYEEKLKKWCEFDSNVGWGKFDVNVKVNEETGDFSGELTINECFIVDRNSKLKICEFVKGYCKGVIETLLCVQVILDCTTCPFKNRFKTKCVFLITLNE